MGSVFSRHPGIGLNGGLLFWAAGQMKNRQKRNAYGEKTLKCNGLGAAAETLEAV